MYALTYNKLLATIFKYIPQIIAHHRRKSTEAWSIYQVLLDLGGGILSLLQLVLDSYLQGDWAGITGNPVKFGLANFSMLADLIFMVQHFILYRRRKDDTRDPTWDDHGPDQPTESDPLLQR